MHSRVTAVAVD